MILRNIYEDEITELKKLTRDEATELIKNGVQVGYPNNTSYYHGSEEGTFGWNEIKNLKDIDDFFNGTKHLYSKLSIHPVIQEVQKRIKTMTEQKKQKNKTRQECQCKN